MQINAQSTKNPPSTTSTLTQATGQRGQGSIPGVTQGGVTHQQGVTVDASFMGHALQAQERKTEEGTDETVSVLV